jgi:uncharacterized protein (TIGR00251 family)
MKIIETKEGAIVEVFVKPSSPKFVVAFDGHEVVAYCTEEPVKGKVNKELVKEFSKLFHSRVEIVSGFASKRKRLLIVGMNKNDAEHVIAAWGKQ